MARPINLRKSAAWQRRLQQFTASGMTVSKFCDRENVSVATFHSSCPWKKSSVYFFHLQNVRFVRVLRTRDRIVRSKRLFIHSLLARLLQFTQTLRLRFPAV